MNKETDHIRLLPNGSDDGASDFDFEMDETRERDVSRKHALHWNSILWRALRSMLFILAIMAVSFWAGTQIPIRRVALDSTCAAHTTQWSPVLEDVEIRYNYKEFNGSFMNENIYRKAGSAEVDKAWEDLGVDYTASIISYEDGLKSGLGPSHVQRAEKYGGGFPVNVEGLHHLHCLNLLRKSLWFNFDRYKTLGQHAFKNQEEILRLHTTHCLDIIRQVLMCNVDTAVLGQVWTVDAQGESLQAFPDFNTRHKCKNYQDVQDWARQHMAPSPANLPDDYLAPPVDGVELKPIP